MFGGDDVTRSVQVTSELTRILAIPRRTWTEDQAAAFARDLSAALKRPEGRMSLRPLQAVALYEAAAVGRLVAPMGVGSGKTLISLLLPLVMGSRRPLLLTRANLIEKTKREARELSFHWPIPNYIQIRSYELLGRSNHADDLILCKPDLVILDEAHRARNRRAAVTKRLIRFAQAFPATQWAVMSGTMTRKSLLEWAHLIEWALRSRSPVPGRNHWSQLEEWAAALDEKDGANEVLPGALYYFCNPAERADLDPVNGVRRAVRRRLVETQGVVATVEGHLGSSLMIQAVETDMSPAIDAAVSKLRNTWETPDGWPLADPMRVAAHVRELGLGFFYIWDPRPPKPWIDARKEWSSVCRVILTDNHRNLDSEKQVVQAVDAGHYPWAKPVLEAWRAVKATFNPNTVPVWLDESILNFAATWAARSPGIVWTAHVAFAEALARKTGLAYYGQEGLDSLGRPVEAHPAKESLIASVASCGEGRNLQKWARNLVTSCPSSGQIVEQVMGRTHRDGQDADEVVFDVLTTVAEHVDAFHQATREARYIQASTGQDQRLLYADVEFPSPEDCALRSGPRWHR